MQLLVCDGEPTRMIEAWACASLAVVVDAVLASPPVPGRLHRIELDRADGWDSHGRSAPMGSAWVTRSAWPERSTGCLNA